MATSKFAVRQEPDMSRNKELAGQTVYKDGFAVSYNENGYASKAVKSPDPTYRGHTDQTAENNGLTTDKHMWTDEQLLTAEQLQQIADIRAKGASGEISWAESNAQANAIRSGSGFSIDQSGTVIDQEALERSLAAAEHTGVSKYYDEDSGTYKDMSTLPTPQISAAPTAQQQTPTVQPTLTQPTVSTPVTQPTVMATPTIDPLTGVKEGSAQRLSHVQSGAGGTMQSTLAPGSTYTPAVTADLGKLQQVQTMNPGDLQAVPTPDLGKLQQVQGLDPNALQQVQGIDPNALQQLQTMNRTDLPTFSKVNANELGMMGYLDQSAAGEKLQRVEEGGADRLGQVTSAGDKAEKFDVQNSELSRYLDRWLSTAQQQQTGALDFGTNQAITDLTRAQDDAAGAYQTQRNQIAADEAKAKDNQALYAETRGDKGGIGAAQYDAIANTAAQNRMAVNSAQTKLATDTARQIADLRAKGEYEKADALLQLTQQQLSQLMNLEQLALNYNLSVDQFNAQLEQFLVNTGLQVDQFNAQQGWNEKNYNLGVDQANNAMLQWLTGQNVNIGQHNAGVLQKAADLNLSTEQLNADQLQFLLNYNKGVQDSNNANAFNAAQLQQSATDANNRNLLSLKELEATIANQNNQNQKWAQEMTADAVNQNNQNLLNLNRFNADVIAQSNVDQKWAQDFDRTSQQMNTENLLNELDFNRAVVNDNNALKQWETETNLGVDKFNAAQQQWEKELNLSVDEQNAALQRWAAEHALSNQEYADSQALQQQSTLASAGEALLNAGVLPSNEQLTAMGLTRAQAEAYVQMMQASAAVKTSSAASGDTGSTAGTPSASGARENALYLAALNSGMDPRTFVKNNYKNYGLTVQPDASAYENWFENLPEPMGSGGFQKWMDMVNINLSESALDSVNKMVSTYWPVLTDAQQVSVQELFNRYNQTYSYE